MEPVVDLRIQRPLRTCPFPRGALLLWLAMAVVVLLSIPLYATLTALQADVRKLQAGIVEAQTWRVSVPSAEEMASLQATAADVVATEERLQAAFTQASQGRALWASALERLIPAPSLPQVRLSGLKQEQSQLIIQGIAEDEDSLLLYVERLRSSPLFADVRAVSPASPAVPQATTPNGKGTAQPLPFVISLQLKGYEP